MAFAWTLSGLKPFRSGPAPSPIGTFKCFSALPIITENLFFGIPTSPNPYLHCLKAAYEVSRRASYIGLLKLNKHFKPSKKPSQQHRFSGIGVHLEILA